MFVYGCCFWGATINFKIIVTMPLQLAKNIRIGKIFRRNKTFTRLDTKVLHMSKQLNDPCSVKHTIFFTTYLCVSYFLKNWNLCFRFLAFILIACVYPFDPIIIFIFFGPFDRLLKLPNLIFQNNFC